MSVINEIKKMVKYLLGKVVELKDMEPKDAMLGKVVIDIHKKKKKSEFVLVPLYALKQLHAIDRDNAVQATEKRAALLMENKARLLKKKDMTREVLNEYLKSVSWIKVVKENDNSYIAYEGNGRLVAMKKVFSPEDEIMVEVEEYIVSNYPKILRRMNRVQKMNGLI